MDEIRSDEQVKGLLYDVEHGYTGTYCTVTVEVGYLKALFERRKDSWIETKYEKAS